MTIVQKCSRCGNKGYIERKNKCFSCVKDEDPDSVLVGLHLHMIELGEEYLSVVEKAKSNFPRIVHTKNYDEIIDFYETELNLFDEFAVLEDFGVKYSYSKYERRTKEERVLEALKDAYRDSIEVKFQE
jgi:hypothetical protein